VAQESSKPKLRPIEAIIVPDEELGSVLMLRDTEGVQEGHVRIPRPLVPIVARMTGRSTCADIAREVSAESGQDVPVSLVVRIATELEEALFCDGPAYRKAKAEVERAFEESTLRPASHAGGAYHADPNKLASYIDQECLAAAGAGNPKTGAKPKRPKGELRALVSPHIDPWRGALCYGHAYGHLARVLPKDVDTFVVFGTSHAPMHEPFALLRKGFATPLGDVPSDLARIDEIAAAADFDIFRDRLNHKREHSIEFQAVFLRHIMGDRPFRIIPILAGLGENQASGQDPSRNKSIEKVLSAVARVVEETHAIVVAGADLAHVGPRFGDARPYDTGERRSLDEIDRQSLDFALTGNAGAFWEHVVNDLDTRRVCGLGPIYSLLRVANARKGELLHYEQTVDPEEGSIVSHAALALTE
jgi:MEMO1 family protein